MDDGERVLNVHEVAERAGLTVHQVYRRLKRGDIPATFGGSRNQQYQVRVADLDAYMSAGQPLSQPKRDMSMLKVPDVARMTGFTDETVRRLCYEGRLEYVRGAGTRGHLRIYRDSVMAYLARNAA